MALNVARGACMPGARPCVPSFSSNRTNTAFSSRSVLLRRTLSIVLWFSISTPSQTYSECLGTSK